MTRPKYGIRLNTDYKLTHEEYVYIAILVTTCILSTGIGLLIGGIIILAL